MLNPVPKNAKASRGELLIIGTAIYFVFGLISAAIAVMVTPIRIELDLSYTQMGVILGSWQLVYIFVALPLGVAIDKMGLKRALLIGALLISASAVLRALSSDFWSLLASVGVFGIGGPIVSIGLPKLVATWFPAGKRTFPTGVYVTGTALGAAVALAGTQTVLMPLFSGWRGAYLAMGAFGLVVATWWWIRANDMPITDVAPTSMTTKQIRAVLASPAVLFIACVGFSGFMLSHGLNNWLPQILEAKSYDAGQSGLLATVPRIGGILSGLVAAHLAARLGGGIGAATAVLVLCAASLAAVSLNLDTLALVTSLAVLGVASTAIMPIMTALLMEVPGIGSGQMGVAAGIYFTIGEIGGFGGPALLGWLLDLTGSFTPGLVAMVALSLATLIPLWLLHRETFRQPHGAVRTLRR